MPLGTRHLALRVISLECLVNWVPGTRLPEGLKAKSTARRVRKNAIMAADDCRTAKSAESYPTDLRKLVKAL